SAIEPEWLPQLVPDLYRTAETVRTSGERLSGVRQEIFVDLVLSEKETGALPAGFDPGQALRAQLIQQHGSSQQAFLSVDSVQAWLRRYLFLHTHMDAADFPLPGYDTALEMACEGARSLHQFQQNALHCLHATLPQSAVRAVNEHAPEHLVLPSGNRSRIEYPEISPDSTLPDPAAPPRVS